MSAQVDYATLFLMSAMKPLANVHLALNTIIKSTTNFRAYIIISVLYNKVQTLFYISSVSFWDLGVGESDTQQIPKKHMLLCYCAGTRLLCANRYGSAMNLIGIVSALREPTT